MRVNNLFPSEVPRKEGKGRGGVEPETWVAASRFDFSFPSSRHFCGAESPNSPGQVSISVSAPLTSLGPEKQKLELKPSFLPTFGLENIFRITFNVLKIGNQIIWELGACGLSKGPKAL